MATYISRQSGNYTATSTWYTADTGTSSQQITGTATTATTTSYAYSSTFTGTNTKVCDGIMLFCFRTTAGAGGTVSVTLSDDGGSTATREVTINAADIPIYPTWVFFKFGSTLTLDGGTDYKVGVKSSLTGTVTFYRDATASNWNRLIRITDAAATLTTGDITWTVGEWTAAGTFTAFTVTINTTSGTTPTATTNMGNLEVGMSGLLKFDTTASSIFQIQLQGNLRIYAGGEFNLGTTSARIPSTSTATLFFNSGSAGQYGVIVLNGAIFRSAGATLSYVRTKLNANASAAATAMTSADSTGWVNGDVIAIAGTERSTTQQESRTVNSTSGTTINITAGLTNAHSGTTATKKADIILLTRNAKVRGNTTSNTMYLYALDQAIVTMEYTQCFNIGTLQGGSATTPWVTPGKAGFEIESSLSSLEKTFSYCSFQDINGNCAIIKIGTNTTDFSNITLSNCVVYTSYYGWIHYTNYPTSASSAYTLSDCSLVGGVFGTYIIGHSSTITNCNFYNVSNSGGLRIDSPTTGTALLPTNQIITNCELSNNSTGIDSVNTHRGLKFVNCKFWRNASGGWVVGNVMENIYFDGCSFYENGTANFSQANVFFGTFRNCTFETLSGFTTSYGFFYSSVNTFYDTKFINCTFGSGLSHTVSDLFFNSTSNTSNVRIESINTTFGSSTKFGQESIGLAYLSYIKGTNEGGSATTHYTRYIYGRIECDTVIYRTASPSEKLVLVNVPNASALRLEGSRKLIPVASGNTVTVSVYVRKSVIGDGAAYNGNQPRLILRQNDKLGITSDTILDTSTAAGDGAWEQLTGTTAAAAFDGVFEVYIDCTGTAGQVNIDDWTVT